MKPSPTESTHPAPSTPTETDPSAPVQADFSYLVQAARESLQRGELDEAVAVLDEARKQTHDDAKRLAAVRRLEAELVQRRHGRDVGIQQRVDTIRQQFEDGELMVADRLLFQAIETFGEDRRFDSLRQLLQLKHRADLEEKIQGMMDQATELSEDRRDIEAMELIHKAQAVVPPDNPTLRLRLESAAQELRQQTLAHRQERLEKAKQTLDGHISRFDLARARAAAAGAEGELGNPEAVTTLRRYLQWRISEGVHQAVQAAGRSYEQGRFGIAIGHLRQALSLKPDDAWLKKKLKKCEAKQLEQEQALQEDSNWTGCLASIQEAILKQDFPLAERLLQDAVATWGHGRSLDHLQQRFRQERQERVRALLQAARQAHREGDGPVARQHLAKALKIDPQDPSARNLAEALERPEPKIETAEAPEQASAVIQEIQQYCDASDYLKAWRKVQEAVKDHGELEPLVALQRRIAEELLDGF